MVKEKNRRKKRLPVYEFQSLSEENGFVFRTKDERDLIKGILSPKDIFNIHISKFLIWEKYGMVKIVIGTALGAVRHWRDDTNDKVSITHEMDTEKIDWDFDLPNFLYYTIPRGAIAKWQRF